MGSFPGGGSIDCIVVGLVAAGALVGCHLYARGSFPRRVHVSVAPDWGNAYGPKLTDPHRAGPRRSNSGAPTPTGLPLCCVCWLLLQVLILRIYLPHTGLVYRHGERREGPGALTPTAAAYAHLGALVYAPACIYARPTIAELAAATIAAGLRS